MADDKVVHAFPSSDLPENLMQIEPRNNALQFHCSHEAIRLDPHSRQVFCARCTATLDPFDFLLHNAATIRHAWQNHASAKRKIDELHERIEVLAKEEKRLRAMVKRLSDKAGFVNVRGEP